MKTNKSKFSEDKKVGTKLLKNEDSKKIETITSRSHQCASENMDVSLKDGNKDEDKHSKRNNNLMGTSNSFEISKNIIQKQLDNVEKDCSMEIDEYSGSEYVPSDDYNSEVESTKKTERKKKRNNLKQNSSRLKRGIML
jgi:hypothetical protein